MFWGAEDEAEVRQRFEGISEISQQKWRLRTERCRPSTAGAGRRNAAIGETRLWALRGFGIPREFCQAIIPSKPSFSVWVSEMKRVFLLISAVLLLLSAGCATPKETTPRTTGEWQEGKRPSWP